MKRNVKIEISDIAYSKIKEMLSSNTEYSYLRFTSVSQCCSKSNIEISLEDTVTEDDERKLFKDLTLVYNKENLNDYEIIFLIFEDDTFKVNYEKNIKASAAHNNCHGKSCSSHTTCKSVKSCTSSSCGCK